MWRCQEWNQGDDCVSFCGVTWLVIIQRSQVFKGIAYLIRAPVEGLSGPRQYPFASATGTSSRKYSCMFNCPSIILTSTMIPRDALSSDHHYHPGFVGGPGSGSSGRSGCFLSEGGLMSFNGNASCSRVSIRLVCQRERVITGRTIDPAPASRSCRVGAK